jgi:hypothetical protein
LLFIERSILPDLHRVAAARARIAVAGDNDAFLSNPLSLQIAPAIARSILPLKARTPAGRERSVSAVLEIKLEFRRQVAVDFETDADFNQNRCRPGHAFLPWSFRPTS